MKFSSRPSQRQQAKLSHNSNPTEDADYDQLSFNFYIDETFDLLEFLKWKRSRNLSSTRFAFFSALAWPNIRHWFTYRLRALAVHAATPNTRQREFKAHLHFFYLKHFKTLFLFLECQHGRSNSATMKWKSFSCSFHFKMPNVITEIDLNSPCRGHTQPTSSSHQLQHSPPMQRD